MIEVYITTCVVSKYFSTTVHVFWIIMPNPRAIEYDKMIPFDLGTSFLY